jgi:hypothetical protein
MQNFWKKYQNLSILVCAFFEVSAPRILDDDGDDVSESGRRELVGGDGGDDIHPCRWT